MALPEPAWRVKTRPCPFYQQGRCLFEESCNFLHTVTVKEPTAIPAAQKTPSKPPTITIQSPRSVKSPPRSPRISGLLHALRDVIGDDSDEEYEEMEQEQEQPVLDQVASSITDGNNASEEVTITATNGSLPSEHDEDILTVKASGSPLTLTEGNKVDAASTHAPLSATETQPTAVPIIHSPDDKRETLSGRPTSSAQPLTLLPPVEPSDPHLVTLNQPEFDVISKDEDSIDSGYADTWKNPFATSPPRSPINSTFELLSSPFGAPAARVLSPRLSAFLSNEPSPEESSSESTSLVSLDSPHDTRAHSPEEIGTLTQSPASPQNVLLNEESAGAASENAAEEDASHDKISLDESCGDGSTHIWDVEEQTSFHISEEASFNLPSRRHSSTPKLDSHAPYDSGHPFSFPYVEDDDIAQSSAFEVEETLAVNEMSTGDHDAIQLLTDHADHLTTLEAATQGPVPAMDVTQVSLAQTNDSVTANFGDTDVTQLSFDQANEIGAEPAMEDDITRTSFSTADHSIVGGLAQGRYQDGCDQAIVDSPTARLAYLISPAPANLENDTLQSIYDNYSAFPIEHETSAIASAVQSSAIKPPSLQTPPVGLLRERVFTPPPIRPSHSNTLNADSPTSLASPAASNGSALAGRISPFSAPSQERSIWSPDSAPEPDIAELPSSKKVPFGFRPSIASKRTSRSSFAPNRTSRTDFNAISHPVMDSQSDGAASPDPSTGGLRPLRLSSILGLKLASAPSHITNFSVHRRSLHRASISFANVPSRSSLSNNPLQFFSASSIPEHVSNTQSNSEDPWPSPLSSTYQLRHLRNFDAPHSAPIPSVRSGHTRSSNSHDPNYLTARPSSRLSEPSFIQEDDEEDNDETNYDYTIRRPIHPVAKSVPVSRPPSRPASRAVSRPASIRRPPMYAIATPRPTLMFAIASDEVKQVKEALENGDAGPNDSVGPQTALQFALTNNQLTHKMEIVKTLLAYGADPIALKKQPNSPACSDSDVRKSGLDATLLGSMDPATRYYVERADAAHTRRTSALIHRSFFRPLTRMRYELIGQDRALEQLFRVLSIHTRQLSTSPIVVLLCGPSGHGKSLMARKFGSLLDVPTHTVNMTTLNTTQELWKSYSMSPYETPTTCTLAEFLINNEGKRCVVVLDEIEKTLDEKVLWSLLMPWEIGRCAVEPNGRHVDVQKVIWLATSNLGHDLVFDHHEARNSPDEFMSREEYVELMGLLRPRVSERLGASILSRVTTVLPFVPFTLEEKRAICCEALYTTAGESFNGLSTEDVNKLIEGALTGYCASEGARSLYRAVSNQLVDLI